VQNGLSGVLGHLVAANGHDAGLRELDLQQAPQAEYLLYVFRAMTSDFDRLTMGSVHRTSSPHHRRRDRKTRSQPRNYMIPTGIDRTESSKEEVGRKGYGSGFEALIAFVNGLVPSNELIEQALRKTVPMYPPLAVRELVANALIHQDFLVTGTGPMIEIFANRMEITNPGKPLVAADRFLDSPPRSRNEDLASLTRRMGICEERGSGIDKVVFQTELFQLPAPLFEVTEEATRAVLFAHQPLAKMDKDDRVRACYLHACLKYVNREFLTNTSLRERFGIEPHNSAMASRLIKEAVDAGAIAPVDEDAAKKLMKYAPWWAASDKTAENTRR
jgi:ATP-dependent DNA helicase RecG